MNGLLESVVLFLRKGDFERIQKPIDAKMPSLFKNSSSPLEGLIKELEEWAGIDRDLLLYHLSDSKDDGFNSLAMKIVKILKDL